jgi:hypothetical protein
LRKKLLSRLAAVQVPEGQSVLFLTVSPQYDPTSEAEVSADGLRDRLKALLDAFKAFRRAGKKWITGAFVAIELAGTGQVHLHALVIARWIEQDWLNRLFTDVGGRPAVSWIEKARSTTAKEVAKYVTKLCSPYDEAALSGAESRELMDPRLLAAWEVATFSRRMHEAYGVLRQAVPSEDAAEDREIEGPKDSTAPCAQCGVVGHFHWRIAPTRQWLLECRRRGVQALERSVQLLKRTRKKRSKWDTMFYG